MKTILALILLSVFSLDDIILDIFNAASELSEVPYEQLQSDLYAIHESPIDLNATSDEELTQLYFLSPKQIDDILAYADRHPFQSLYELRLIPSLEDYEIRDLLPFVKITNNQSQITNYQSPITDKIYPREVFAFAKHEIITRVDARDIEFFEGTDPIFFQTKYRFDYQRRVTFGLQLRRPPGGFAKDLQYGAYLQLRDLTPHLHTLVAGNFQASFGQGLVLAPVFHSGKSMYVESVGQNTEGLRYYSSVDGEGLHGIGTTIRHSFNAYTRLDVSALYSFKHANDTLWHHLLGANITLRHKQFQIQLTAIENIWSDSIHPYRNAAYNQHYFRGRNQAVLGSSVRYNHGWFDAFGEVATSQNFEISNVKSQISNVKSQMSNAKWGLGLVAGSRFYPTDGVSLIALYRYYSPYFDNVLGYAFSESSRLGDENGGYLGFDITRLACWQFVGYADIFRFSGPKYGIPNAPSLGYDVMVEARHIRSDWRLSFRLRAKEKGALSTYSSRAQFDIHTGPWAFRTTVEANFIPSSVTYGVTVFQDMTLNVSDPFSLHFRLQFFDAREWNNRIYAYEHDVLYAYSIPAVYGLGGRAYLSLRWRIIPQLSLYFRLSETLYDPAWYASKHPSWSPSGLSARPLPSRTDIHLLLRATL